MPQNPTIHASPATLGSRFQIEMVSGRLIVSTIGDKITATGIAAILAVLSTYYSSTLTATQLGALKTVTGDNYVFVGACEVFAAVAPGTDAALAALIVTALKTSGNTVAG